jgi:hypothetical protein
MNFMVGNESVLANAVREPGISGDQLVSPFDDEWRRGAGVTV